LILCCHQFLHAPRQCRKFPGLVVAAVDRPHGESSPAGGIGAAPYNNNKESIMGIKERTRADGTVAFEADVRVANVGRKTGTFDTRKQAQTFIATTTAAARTALRASASNVIDQTRIGGQRNFERAKFADVIVAFCESSASSNRAKKSLAQVPRFVGNVTVAQVDEDWCEQYASRMRATLTPQRKTYAWATIKDYLQYMKVACKWWAKRNKVANPFIGLSTECIPQGWDNKRDRRLQTGEYEKILARINALRKCRAHWRCLFILALETCARQQELVLAQWSEISHDGNLWKIPADHTKKDTARTVPLSPAARAALAELRSLRREGDRRIFEVFPKPQYVSRFFRKIVKRAQIENLRFHDLRHEAISMKVLVCPPEKLTALMKIVGHKDYQSLMRYSHLVDDDVIGMFG
jgi:integrase